jgi:adenosine deaminase
LIVIQICLPKCDETDHHVKVLHDSNLPFVICTDDKGVFNCSLSSEFDLAAKILKLSEKEMFQISRKAINLAFATDEEKEKLKKIWDEFEEQNF